MKNYSNHSSEFNKREDYFYSVLVMKMSVFITLEIFIVLISLLIVSSNSLVIYRIMKVQVEKVKYDFAFIILSASDIGVGLFSVPMLGVRWNFERTWQNMPYTASIASTFFEYFPYNFSCVFTAAIAVHRLVLIRLCPKYKNLFTTKILKSIAIILFLISFTISSILTIPLYNEQTRRNIPFWVYYTLYGSLIIIGTLCTVAVIVTHLYILYFTLRRPDLKIVKKNRSKNYNQKRLTNTVSYICISQLICVIPFLLFRLVDLNGRSIPNKLYADVHPWLGILVYSQCFCNALIILKNKKIRINLKKTDKEEISVNKKS